MLNSARLLRHQYVDVIGRYTTSQSLADIEVHVITLFRAIHILPHYKKGMER